MGRSSTRSLVLFDIDGTLITSNGVGRRLMDEVLASLFGPHVSSKHVPFSGRTDLAIMAEILRPHVPIGELPRLARTALEAYARCARGRIHPTDITVLPGVHRLLHRLHENESVQLGLVTGNLKSTAYLKLEAAGLGSIFPLGAFGSDHENRNHLPALASRRAYELNGVRYSGQDIVVIGDSIHDVRCGHAVGAFCVAVATGLTSRTALAAERPHVLLEDLSETDALCRSVLQSRKPRGRSTLTGTQL